MNADGSQPLDDFVDDRALEDATGDQFGHVDFAQQAARTVRVVRTPANVAVYAPWGSGKTSLANLIRAELGDTNAGFVYFDAFKYAEAPLRRQFISQVAHELKDTDEKFSRGLYEEEVTSGISLRKSELRPLINVAVGFALAAVVFTALVALIIAGVSAEGPLRDEWAEAMRRLLPAIFASSVVIGPIVALARDQLHITRRRYAPESDEEFERLFDDLVRRALAGHKQWDRLVVFIDELDRCAAGEVASTLETIRTFLEVKNCIFIVAADRQVLETAVARRARQETPHDPRNPYYSSGSAYLDKIFQYQWQLPPVMPSSLARFAQELVRGREVGVWAEVDPAQVVSVLVPLHVQSPRRVKELLNAFAMTYRVAERRIIDGRLDGDLKARAPELAKLICLQLEFPIFAADLRNEFRLPELVLTRFEDGDADRPNDVSPEVWDRAGAYAAGRVDLDVVIARDGGSSTGVQVRGPQASGRDGTDSAGDATEASAEDGEEQSGGDERAHEDASATEIAAVQGHLLVRYLQKTRRISGPGVDLVFLEGPGYAFGLPTPLTLRLTAAATEGRVADAVREIEPLEDDAQRAALQLLARHVRDALPGIEGENAVSTLLGAVGGLPALALEPVVDQLTDAVTVAVRDDQLPPDDVLGALLLGLGTNRSAGEELVKRALAHPEVTARAYFAVCIADRANLFAAEHVARLGEVVAALVCELPWEDPAKTLSRWSDDRAGAVLRATRDPLAALVASAQEEEEAAPVDSGESSDAEPAPEAAAPTGTAEPPAASEAAEAETVMDAVVSELEVLLDAAISAGRKGVAEELLGLTLVLDAQEARNLVERRLPALAPIESPSVTRLLLEGCRRRVLTSQRRWLDALDPAIVGALSDGKRLLEAVVASSWRKTVEAAEQSAQAHVEAFAASAARVAGQLEWHPAEGFVTKVKADAAVGGSDDVTLTKWLVRVSVCRTFDEAGLLRPEDWHSAYLAAVVELATGTPPDAATQEKARTVIVEEAVDFLPGTETAQLDGLDAAIIGSPWLPSSDQYLARVRLATRRRRGGEQVAEPFGAAELVAALEAATEEVARATLEEAAGTWLGGLRPSIDEGWVVLHQFSNASPSAPLRTGIEQYSAALNAEERTSLVARSLEDFPDHLPSEDFLEALRFHESDLAGSVDLVIEAFNKATNEEQRRFALRLWGALRLTDHGAGGRLLDSVMIPLVRHGKTSRELALQHLNLVQALPDRDRRRLATTFEEHAEAEEWSSVQRRLVSAGLMVERGLPLMKRIEHLPE